MRPLALWLVFAALATLGIGGCGVRGPLYLPEPGDTSGEVPAEAPAAQPGAEEDEEDDEEDGEEDDEETPAGEAAR